MDINIEAFILIHEEVLITTPKGIIRSEGEEVSYELFWDDTHKRFVATKLDPAKRFNDAPDTLTYILLKTGEDLTEDEREAVLDYRLSNYTDAEEVQLSDLFLHGDFVELVSFFREGVEFSITHIESF